MPFQRRRTKMTKKSKQQRPAAPQQQGAAPMHQKALKQLKATLRSPASHNQQQEILRNLKSNSSLITKQRRQQQAGGGVPVGNVGVGNVGVGGVGNVNVGLGGVHQQLQQQQMLPQQAQGQDNFVYTCNSCKAHVETRYHCTVCDDFDLCVPCYDKERHSHKMEKLGLDIDVGASSGDLKPTNPQEARKLAIKRCIQSLVHACQCRDANCRLPSCQKMKRVVTHTKICKRKTNGDCLICKQLIALCCYHAKHCQESMCSVPFCSSIKQKHQAEAETVSEF